MIRGLLFLVFTFSISGCAECLTGCGLWNGISMHRRGEKYELLKSLVISDVDHYFSKTGGYHLELGEAPKDIDALVQSGHVPPDVLSVSRIKAVVPKGTVIEIKSTSFEYTFANPSHYFYSVESEAFKALEDERVVLEWGWSRLPWDILKPIE